MTEPIATIRSSMKQVKVCLPDDLREIVQARAQRSGHNVSEEIRLLVWAGLALKVGTEEYQREVAITNEAWASQ